MGGGEGRQAVVRIDPQTNRPASNVPLGTEPRAVTTGNDTVWVTNIRAASVSRIDPDGPKRSAARPPSASCPTTSPSARAASG